jgi:hypothetical protein
MGKIRKMETMKVSQIPQVPLPAPPLLRSLKVESGSAIKIQERKRQNGVALAITVCNRTEQKWQESIERKPCPKKDPFT